jgi:hypothetical protein
MRRAFLSLVNLPNHWRWTIWVAYTPAWTVSLLVPRPIEARSDQVVLWWSLFVFSKIVHVSAYALWTVMTCWLRTALWVRILLVLVILLHGLGTEYLQLLMNIGRHGSWRDVGLDWFGTALGLVLGWLLFLRSPSAQNSVNLPPAPGEPVAVPSSPDHG